MGTQEGGGAQGGVGEDAAVLGAPVKLCRDLGKEQRGLNDPSSHGCASVKTGSR